MRLEQAQVLNAMETISKGPPSQHGQLHMACMFAYIPDSAMGWVLEQIINL